MFHVGGTLEKYRKKGESVRRNKEGRKLFEPTSRQVLYRDGHWIPNRKRNYELWFKFLQHCERDPSRKVNWNKYRGWGGHNQILGMKFDVWWKENWIELFGSPVRGKKPKFQLTNPSHTNYDPMRICLLVYEEQLKFPDLGSYEISQKIQERESRKRYPIPTFTEGVGYDGGVIDKRVIQRRMSNYRKRIKEIMDNVCEGKFP